MEKESSNQETSMNNAREERLRKIVERGSDRMALITGRIQSLHPPSPPPSPSLPPPHRALPTQQTRHPIDGSPLQTSHEASNEVSRQNNEVSTANTINDAIKIEPQLLVEKAQSDTEPSRQHPRGRFFTSKRLNSCIVETEITRSVCSLIIALLVVLSYVDYALFGTNLVNSESVVASRPLYIILLTDVTIVLARMVLAKREEAEEGMVGGLQDGHNWVEAVKLLERGLVVYQTIRGVFIDVSVYAVVVICGLSLV